MPLVKVALNQIEIDTAMQCREKQDVDTIAEYAAAYKVSAKIPPMIVFNDGKSLWLADGFHRHPAAKMAQLKQIVVDERKGTKRDAILFAVGANAEHGMRRTAADRRRAVLVLLNDAEWSKWPSREIALRCAVSHTFVLDLKKTPEKSSGGVVAASQRQIDNQNASPAADEDIEGVFDEAPASKTELETAFEAHNPMRDIATRIHEIVRDWKAIGQESHPFISQQSVVSHLQNAVAEIRMGQPHAVCPYCKGSKCKACKDTGWVTKSVFDTAPDN